MPRNAARFVVIRFIKTLDNINIERAILLGYYLSQLFLEDWYGPLNVRPIREVLEAARLRRGAIGSAQAKLEGQTKHNKPEMDILVKITIGSAQEALEKATA